MTFFQLADARDLADTLPDFGFLDWLGDVAGQDDDPFFLRSGIRRRRRR